MSCRRLATPAAAERRWLIDASLRLDAAASWLFIDDYATLAGYDAEITPLMPHAPPLRDDYDDAAELMMPPRCRQPPPPRGCCRELALDSQMLLFFMILIHEVDDSDFFATPRCCR